MMVSKSEALNLRKPTQSLQKACCLLLILPLLLVPLWQASAAVAGYTNGRMILVSEPETHSNLVYYNKSGEQLDWSQLKWSNYGKFGKAVDLPGDGSTVQVLSNQIRLPQMTLAMWVYWRGATPGAAPNAIYDQRLFSLTRGSGSYLTMYAHSKDPNNPKINGIRLRFQDGSKIIDLYNEAENTPYSYGLPQNQWHHITLTSDGRKLLLYMDGVLWFEATLILSMRDMRPNSLLIGGGIWDTPSLNALIDEVSLFDRVLTADQIQKLMQGADPLDKDVTVPTKPPVYIPTEPTTTTTEPTTTTLPDILTTTEGPEETQPRERLTDVLGIPMWGVYIMVGILGLYVVFFIVLSARHNNQHPGGDGHDED